MSSYIYYIICAVLVSGVLTGIYLMSRVKTAIAGNLISSICVIGAVALTLLYYHIISDKLLLICMAAGVIIGILWILKIKMIQMPQLVALYNGFGGAASAIIGIMILIAPPALNIFPNTASLLAIITGAITFAGSCVAALKLSSIISQRSITLRNHQIYTILLLVLSFLIAILSFIINIPSPVLAIVLFIFSGLFGIFFSIRIGGADMPITISLLNSLSGVAGAIAGLAVGDVLLVSVGGIIGASGLFLTRIMCKAMNRSLSSILLGKTTAVNEKELKKNEKDYDNIVKNQSFDTIKLLMNAKKIIIIPGYGMALSGAQYVTKSLTDLLEAKGAVVDFAIHPVAGRMPGHMNIILCEADVPYEKLFEMDFINPIIDSYDVALIIGANDVINPAAKEAEGTPIYGMPIINAEKAKHVIICNFDLKPGYSGVDNPLYNRKTGVTLMLGDAKETISEIIKKIS